MNDAFPSFGAHLIEDGEQPRTRFRLWAPNAERVDVEAQGFPAFRMTRLDDGWFETELDCGPGTRYRYRVRDDLAVPDPASRRQDGDVHDASIVCDPSAYHWKHADWRGRPWHEAVLMELHPGLCGGFNGIRQRLPALAALGVTAIELMPVADFAGARNWGYDGVLPYAPDATYGTPEQLKALIDAAHGHGIMVLLDVVYNHFGPDGNYLGAYAEDFFREDMHTPWGQAIDFRRRQVRDFFIENALYWLREFRFDGLRFDAVHAISEKDFLVEMAERIRAAVGANRHVHLVLENDDNLVHLLDPGRLYDAQWNDDLHHAFHVLLTGEREGYYIGYVDEPAGRLARGLAEGFIYQGEPSPFADGRPRGEPSAHLPPTAFVSFLQNHDQIGNRAFGERLTTLADPRALRTAMALLLLSPQIPMLFMGEEIGARQPFLYFTGFAAPELAQAVRDGRRLEFARFAAFADPQRREQIPDPNAVRTHAESMPRAGEDSAQWGRLIADLIRVRKQWLFPRLDRARALDASVVGPAAVLARWRMNDGSVLRLAANLAPDPVALEVASSGTLLFQTEGAVASFAEGDLPGYALLALLEGSQ